MTLLEQIEFEEEGTDVVFPIDDEPGPNGGESTFHGPGYRIPIRVPHGVHFPSIRMNPQPLPPGHSFGADPPAVTSAWTSGTSTHATYGAAGAASLVGATAAYVAAVKGLSMVAGLGLGAGIGLAAFWVLNKITK